MPPLVEKLEEKGVKNRNPVDSTKVCDDCKHTHEKLVLKSFGPFDTHADARNTWKTNGAIQAAIRLELVKAVWKLAWTTFNCTNAKCPVKKACNNKPKWWEIVIVLDAVGGGPNPLRKFYFAVALQREIMCISGDAQGDDVPPVAEIDQEGLPPPGSGSGSDDEDSSFEGNEPLDAVWLEPDGTLIIERS